MRFSSVFVVLAAAFVQLISCQQYVGDVIPNSLPNVPGSEITYFRVTDPSGKNKNLTLTNYYSHGKSNKRLVESNVKRAVVIIHGLNRDPGTYMSNMLSALDQVKSDPNVNFDTVAIMSPYFPNGDDKTTGYPWTDGLSPGRGSTSNQLVWKSSQWSAGANNQYPYTSKNISSYTVLDQIVQYFDNRALFPKMNQIVIAGHSLGGQTVQRYAAIGVQLGTKSPVSYWVGNPNSYAWLDSSRPLSTAGCSDYDDYRDGYSNFADYPMTYGVGLVAAGRAAIQANYNSKAVNYGRGLQDLGDDSSSCAPRTAGKDRNERFFNFIKAFPPSCSDPTGPNCDTVDFVNTGHDGGAMMASAAGQARLFLDNFYGNGNRSYDFGYPRQQAGDDPYPNPALNTTASSINNNTYAGNMTYWGCWSDQSPQTLPNMIYQSNANTIDKCTAACASAGNTIAGMEFGTQCFCGSSLGYQAQQVIESSCQNTCPGNNSQTCGGYSRLSIFSKGRPQLQPTPGTPETVSNFTYISCYTEASSGRALTGKGTSSNRMSLEFCADYCSGYQFFGTEYGSECYCGNSFAAGASRTNDDECNMLCANDPSEFCGAGNRLTVYQNDDWAASSSATKSTGPSATSSGSGSGSQDTSVSCPASNGNTITSGGKSFIVECGIDHLAGDLTSATVNSFQQCIDVCAQNSKCVDVSLSGTACYLKSTLGAAIPNGPIWGAKLVAAASTSSTASLASSSSLSSSSATVSLSSTTGSSTRTSSTVAVSSTSTSPTASVTPATCPGSDGTTIVSNGVSFLIECGIDHSGGDMKMVIVTSFQQCIDNCAKTAGCVDLSLSGVACYLKSKLGGAIKNGGVWGAKVVEAVASSSSLSSMVNSTSSSAAVSASSVSISSSSSSKAVSSTTVSITSLSSSTSSVLTQSSTGSSLRPSSSSSSSFDPPSSIPSTSSAAQSNSSSQISSLSTSSGPGPTSSQPPSSVTATSVGSSSAAQTNSSSSQLSTVSTSSGTGSVSTQPSLSSASSVVGSSSSSVSTSSEVQGNSSSQQLVASTTSSVRLPTRPVSTLPGAESSSSSQLSSSSTGSNVSSTVLSSSSTLPGAESSSSLKLSSSSTSSSVNSTSMSSSSTSSGVQSITSAQVPSSTGSSASSISSSPSTSSVGQSSSSSRLSSSSTVTSSESPVATSSGVQSSSSTQLSSSSASSNASSTSSLVPNSSSISSTAQSSTSTQVFCSTSSSVSSISSSAPTSSSTSSVVQSSSSTRIPSDSVSSSVSSTSSSVQISSSIASTVQSSSSTQVSSLTSTSVSSVPSSSITSPSGAQSSSIITSSASRVASSSVSSSPSSSLQSSAVSSSTSSSVQSSTSSTSLPITPASVTTSSRTSTTSLTSSTTQASAVPSGFKALGCYLDSGARILPTSGGSSSTQTPQQCALACSKRGFKYSGTEYSQECWCGHSAPSSSASAPISQCNMKCSGDKTQLCGAGNRISVMEDLDWKQTFFARQSYASWNLMGCYVDSVFSRTLSRGISLSKSGGSGNATIANCMDACQAKGHKYCGEEYYSECFGGDTLPVARLAPGADPLAAGCNYPCYGNKTEACGGSDRILVYVNTDPWLEKRHIGAKMVFGGSRS